MIRGAGLLVEKIKGEMKNQPCKPHALCIGEMIVESKGNKTSQRTPWKGELLKKYNFVRDFRLSRKRICEKCDKTCCPQGSILQPNIASETSADQVGPVL